MIQTAGWAYIGTNDLITPSQDFGADMGGAMVCVCVGGGGGGMDRLLRILRYMYNTSTHDTISYCVAGADHSTVALGTNNCMYYQYY